MGVGLFFTHGSLAARAPMDLSGKPIVLEEPPSTAPSACSFRRAICVHGGDAETALGALASLERAWEAGLALGVRLPTTFDAYLDAAPARAAIASRDLLSRLDRAHAFATLDARLPAGCARDFDDARALYEVSALTTTPAIDEGSLRAESTSLARLAVPCEAIDPGPFQAHPDRALVDRFVAPGYDEGASLFFSYLDDAFATRPGGVVIATLALAATRTPDNADDHWVDEPDVFDVLHASLEDALFPGSTAADVLVGFAVAREVATAPPARLDWDVAWPATARTLASPEGVAPTGSAYVRIDTKGRKPGARFVLDATWEELARIRWVVVKLDASGHELARLEATAAPKATSAHLQVVDLDAVSALLVVATNVGPWDGTYDPDDDVVEPHGWLLTIGAE